MSSASMIRSGGFSRYGNRVCGPDRMMRLCQCLVFPNISLARSLTWSLTACSPWPAATRPRAATSSNSAIALAWASSSRAARSSSSVMASTLSEPSAPEQSD